MVLYIIKCLIFYFYLLDLFYEVFFILFFFNMGLIDEAYIRISSFD